MKKSLLAFALCFAMIAPAVVSPIRPENIKTPPEQMYGIRCIIPGKNED